jgi:hypothetical protein
MSHYLIFSRAKKSWTKITQKSETKRVFNKESKDFFLKEDIL